MAALSFGNFGNAFDPSAGGLSLGASVLKSPTDFQYRKAPVVKSPTDFQFSKPKPRTSTGLSFGKALPKMSGYMPKAGPNLGNFLSTLSFGTSMRTTSAPRSSAGISSVPQIDTVTIDGAAGAADAAQNLASSIFGDMLQPASFGGGAASGAGRSGGFLDRMGPTELAIGVVGLGLVFMLISGPTRGKR